MKHCELMVAMAFLYNTLKVLMCIHGKYSLSVTISQQNMLKTDKKTMKCIQTEWFPQAGTGITNLPIEPIKSTKILRAENQNSEIEIPTFAIIFSKNAFNFHVYFVKLDLNDDQVTTAGPVGMH